MTAIELERKKAQLKKLLLAKKKNSTIGKSFREAAAECNAVPVKVFTDELRRRIDQWPDDNA